MPTPSERESALRSFDAWIAPNGTFHPVNSWGHDLFAYQNHDCSGYELTQRGWIHFNGVCFTPRRGTQAQLDTLFDWERLHNRSVQLHSFEVL